MENQNTTPQPALKGIENMRKQNIMLEHGLNVKADGSWGSWQEEQWNKLKPTLVQENNTIKAKRCEFALGLFCFLPSILGTISFLLALFDNNSHFATLYNLSGDWTDGEYNVSPAPIFMGLMAIAGAHMIKDSIVYVFKKLS